LSPYPAGQNFLQTEESQILGKGQIISDPFDSCAVGLKKIEKIKATELNKAFLDSQLMLIRLDNRLSPGPFELTGRR